MFFHPVLSPVSDRDVRLRVTSITIRKVLASLGGLDRWVVFFIFLFEHLIVCAMSLFLGGSGFGIAVRLRKLSFRRHFQSLASRNNNKALTRTDKEKPPAIGEQRITAKRGNNGGSDWPADWSRESTSLGRVNKDCSS